MRTETILNAYAATYGYIEAAYRWTDGDFPAPSEMYRRRERQTHAFRARILARDAAQRRLLRRCGKRLVEIENLYPDLNLDGLISEVANET